MLRSQRPRSATWSTAPAVGPARSPGQSEARRVQSAVKDEIDRLFARQQGLATPAQLVDLGLSRQVVRAHVQRGLWRLVLPQVVCREARALDARQRLLAAYLMAGAQAFISSWSAAA